MPVTNKIINLNFSTPAKILEANDKRVYVRFHVNGEYFYLGGPSVTKDNGIQCSWQGLRALRQPETTYEYWAVGQCSVRVMEVIKD